MTQPAAKKLRFGLSYAYRNAAANNIRQILYADGLNSFTLFNYLDLFPDPPREFFQLDRTIVEIARRELNISFN